MKWLDEFRDPQWVGPLRERINRAAQQLDSAVLMEVCGTHTMAIARYGIRELLPKSVRLVSGPGCPVCVTPVDYVDHAIALARQPQTVLATFGDMVRVPGSTSSLTLEMARGAQVRVVLSSLDALKLAQRCPEQQIVFLAVGFETTAPTIAATLKAAAAARVNNFSVLCAHKTVPEALEGLISSGRATVQALLCPPHVSAIIGTRPYERLTARGVPCVIGGFEPLDILLAVGMLLEQLAAKQARVENEYSRVVRPNGNERAKALLEDVFEPCDAIWRGLGMVPKSGLRLNARYSNFDAAQRFSVQVEPAQEPAGCRCGEVLLGNINPVECPLFGTVCTPEDPVGACMVSSEGTCAAHFRYGGHQ